MSMARFIMRSLILSAVFTLAYTLLRPFGLGWLVIVAFVGYIGYMLYRASQQVAAENRESTERFSERLRGRVEKHEQGDRAESLAQQEQERARREADCGLTHEERVRFQSIVRGLSNDEAS